MSKIYVLHCIHGMGSGGAEKDIINWSNKLKEKEIYFDFLIRSNDIFYEKEIEKNGGKIFYTAAFPSHIFRNVWETYKFFKKNYMHYQAVHVHGNTAFYIWPLILAKRFNIPVRIFHIHSTHAANRISNVFHKINSKLLPLIVTENIACSKKAAKFGNMKKALIVKNMVDDKQFYPINDQNLIKQIKKKYNTAKFEKIFVHIGRFLEVKNHSFLLEIFKKILEKEPSSCLILVGVGPLMNKIKHLSDEMGISKNIRFLGEISNVNEILNISNVMIFPSIYEGIPLTLLEAQLSETRVIASDSIDKESKITPYLQFMSLNKSAKKWAEKTLKLANESIEFDSRIELKKKNYTIDSEVEKLAKLYKGGTK